MTQHNFQAIVIGASSGAVDALSKLLPLLPETFPLPVIIVVHMPPDKKSMLAEIYHEKCRLEVKEAEDKEPIAAGTIYFAAPDYHLLVETNKILSFAADEEVLFSRPSIDVLFESAADAYGETLIGIIMTGANEDGAAGLKEITNAGGTAIVQDPEQAFSKEMPRAALAACPAAKIMSLEEIAKYLQEITS